MVRQTGITRGEDIWNRLRSDVLDGELKPGTKLAFGDLSRRYEASTGVLREVLPRLVEQGLATWESQLGYRVVDVTVDDLRCLTDARVTIECIVLGRAIDEGSLEWETEVVAAHHALAKTPTSTADGSLNPRWIEAHATFHRALLDGCGNPRLVDIAQRLRDSAEVYRCWTYGSSADSRRDVAAEHRLITEAVMERQAGRAVELLKSHIETTTEHLLAARAESENVGFAS